ncbi:MAG: N-formylglutamate amidohydrolase [Sulfitobacter sp.]
MNLTDQVPTNDIVLVLNPEGGSSVVVVCEHASCFIPEEFGCLGLSGDDQKSHAAWDLGAMAVAKGLSERLDAKLIASGISRLVYDCNRPPSAPDAMPSQSEVIKVPGNVDLTPEQRRDRIKRYYDPFRAKLNEALLAKSVLVTIHSFTPIYFGTQRHVEIGILHDTDSRLADVMLQIAPAHLDADVRRNEPYGPQDGVTHTLKEHAIGAGHLNVMLEIRNDLIRTPHEQDAMAARIAGWLTDALERVQISGSMQ